MSAPRVYRAVLFLLPGWLRRRHGEAMGQSFEEALVSARRKGASAVVAVWARGIWDILSRAVYERFGRGSGDGWRGLGPDLKFGGRAFLRQPGSTFLAVLMLSLGIAATTAVFTLADGIFLRPLPFPDSDRLVYLDESAPRWNLEFTGINYKDFEMWRERTTTFESMATYDVGTINLVAGATVDRVIAVAATHDLLPTLGLDPILGRGFTAAEDAPGGDPVALIGYDLWRSRFAGRSDVLGETLKVDGELRTIVGVLPPEARVVEDAGLWIPLSADPEPGSESYSLDGLGRLKPDVDIERARADLEAAHAPIWAERDTARVVSPVAFPLRDMLTADLGPVALGLGVAAGLVLLIACGNVASLLIARSFARRRELGVRAALGAGRRRIARQLFTESLVLAAVAAPFGLVLGFGAIRLLAGRIPEGLPTWMVLAPSWRTGLFAVGLVTAITILFGWAPVLQARREDLRDALTEGTGRTGASRGQRRTLNGLVMAEITLAALLLVSSGLLYRSFQELRDVDPGFRTENVLGFRVALPEATYPDSAAQASFYRELMDRLGAIPGVRAAGGITCPPLGCHWGNFFQAEGGLGSDPDDPNPVVLYRYATPGYFDAMGIRAVHGRLPTGSDNASEGTRTVVINQAFADRFFPDVENPVGRRIAMRHGSFDDLAWIVVGVAADVRHYGLDEPMRSALYFPLDSSPAASLATYVWTTQEPTAVLADVRRAVRELDPELALFQVGTTRDAVAESLALRRTSIWAMLVFAGLALVLALGGIYGVLSYTVGQRVREIGVRVALGASRGAITRMVLRSALLLTGTGLALGLLAALAASRVMEGMLVGFSPLDPLTYAAVTILLTFTALAATLVPVRRALKVEPGTALREE